MISLFQRLPLWFKTIFIYAAIWATFFVVLNFLLLQLVVFIGEEYGLSISVDILMSALHFPTVAIGIVVCTILFALYAYDHQVFMNRIKYAIGHSLEDRKIEEQFADFVQAPTYDRVLSNLEQVFKLYRSFDSLKTSRLALEISSIRLLSSQVEEGVIIVDSEKVVTYINYVAEGQLGLIPDEILGEDIARKISQEDVLEGLENALQFDQKLVEHRIELKDSTPYCLSVLPVKDKFGEIIRALIILAKAPEKKSEDPIKKSE